MYWIILPSGKALNLAQVVATSEGKRYLRTDEEVAVTTLHFAQSTQEDTLPRLVLWGEDRDFLRRVLENLSTDGVWP